MKPRTIIRYTTIALSILSISALSWSCDKDDAEDEVKGNMQLSMTDAPADDNDIQAVFITIAGVSVDGEPMTSFEKQTIEISSYTEGETKLILDDQLEVGSYSNASLIFDFESDANGGSPGCYVLTADGTKHDLNSSSNMTSSVEFNNTFEISSDATTELVIDMDLRKSVKREGAENSGDQYEFVAATEFSSALRMEEKGNTGMIEGNYSGTIESDEQIVVYAYEKGDFNSSELEADVSSKLRYDNAVTSANVDAQGNYTLSFLHEGEYELKAAKFKNNADNEMEFQSALDLNVWLGGIIANTVTVDAQSEITVDLSL